MFFNQTIHKIIFKNSLTFGTSVAETDFKLLNIFSIRLIYMTYGYKTFDFIVSRLKYIRKLFEIVFWSSGHKIFWFQVHPNKWKTISTHILCNSENRKNFSKSFPNLIDILGGMWYESYDSGISSENNRKRFPFFQFKSTFLGFHSDSERNRIKT